MLEGGEDVRFLARRLVILASEDVGNADPAALPLAMAAAQACELVGLPECQLALAQAVTYLACAPKSNASTVGIGEARRDVREGRLLPVPVHLRGTGYGGAKRLGHGQTYQYAHDEPGAVAARITWASSASTIGPWTGASSRSWPSGWPRSAPACAKAGNCRVGRAKRAPPTAIRAILVGLASLDPPYNSAHKRQAECLSCYG